MDEVNRTLINPIMMECPLCGELHLVDRRTRTAKATIKGEIIKYQEEYYVCENTEEGENEFIPSKVMDANLLAARDAYRSAHHLFTSQDIINLRNRYGLTQRELAKLLGWGEATVSRYETKQIQDETYDGILHVVSEDALEAKQFLIRNRSSFDESRYFELAALIDKDIERTSSDYLTKRLLVSKYSEFQNAPSITGGIELDIDKTCNMVAFFASHCVGLFKVKLMKLLWYTDALFFKEHGRSMSGLVYQHMPMGALPVGHYELMSLVPHEEIYENYENTSYRILPKEQYDESLFTSEELDVLYRVLHKFGSYTGTDLAAYMHNEVAYIQTADHAYIPYSLSAKVSF
ncbi:MAG: DUF4065 domain-containing protein [Oscillospiraceae bacterium]|nr:DUF4065 domain-containing protein [Oscillospiraceae bacterium]